MDDILSASVSGIHPIESGTLDIFYFRKKYKDKVSVIGNIDLITLVPRSTKDTF